MSIADQYLSLSQYAEKRGSSDPTLKKLVDQAKGTPFDLGEPDGEYGKTKIWHIDKWRQLELFRLSPAIKEAINLGFVVSVEDSRQRAAFQWNAGLEEGRRQGINHIATGSYEDE